MGRRMHHAKYAKNEKILGRGTSPPYTHSHSLIACGASILAPLMLDFDLLPSPVVDPPPICLTVIGRTCSLGLHTYSSSRSRIKIKYPCIYNNTAYRTFLARQSRRDNNFALGVQLFSLSVAVERKTVNNECYKTPRKIHRVRGWGQSWEVWGDARPPAGSRGGSPQLRITLVNAYSPIHSSYRLIIITFVNYWIFKK